MALHQTARFGLAKQNAKETAAAGVSVPYIRGRVQQHGLNPRYEMIDTSGEHTGVHSRSTALQSTPIRAGSIIDVSFRHRLYPSMVGYELIGLGFVDQTDNSSTTATLTINATGGTFTITVNGVTTSPALAYNASASTIQAALVALSTVGTGGATVSGSGPFTIVINSVVGITTNAASLTGGASTAALSSIAFVGGTSTTAKLTFTGVTSGNFTLTVNGMTTANIAYSASLSAATIDTALELVVGTAGVAVTGSNGGPYTFTFNRSVTASTFTVADVSLNAGTAVIAGFYYNHTFTLPAADRESWLTVYDYIGETGGFDRIVRDVRLSQLSFTADNTGIIVAGSGLGLVMSNAAGTETFIAETDAVISQANGSFTLTAVDSASGAISTGTPRSHTISFDNPLDESEQELHTLDRATLSPTGKTITGTIAGLPFSETLFKQMYWGQTAGTGVVIPYQATSAFTWNWQSASNISTAAAVPYKMTFSIPVVQIEMQPFDLTGGGQVLFDISYRLVDAISTAPITITLQNSISSYAGT